LRINLVSVLSLSIALTLISCLFFILQNKALAQNTPISNNQNPNYNIKPGSWVKYVINGPSVHSDNKFLELTVKGLLATSNPFFGNMTGTSSISSVKDIQWLQINITRISGDNITTRAEIKPLGSQPITFKPVSRNISSAPFPFILPKNVQIGERFPINSTASKIPSLIVNRTVQKDIGGHNVEVYELTGQQNIFNTTSGIATQSMITGDYDKITGLPLQLSFDFEGGFLFGTVTASLGISAIDWLGGAVTIPTTIHIDSNSSPSQIMNFYNQKIPFGKVAQLILNQTSLNSGHTPTSSEISLLNSINDELRSDGIEFLTSSYGTSDVCNPNSIKTAIVTCDQDAAFIHQLCSESAATIAAGTLNCPDSDTIHNSVDIYLQKRSISDPQTDALAYFRLANILGRLNPSNQ
jgi:hypothetical protein